MSEMLVQHRPNDLQVLRAIANVLTSFALVTTVALLNGELE
jgi:hypothetical protein